MPLFSFIDTSGLTPLKFPSSLTDLAYHSDDARTPSAPSPESVARFHAAMDESSDHQTFSPSPRQEPTVVSHSKETAPAISSEQTPLLAVMSTQGPAPLAEATPVSSAPIVSAPTAPQEPAHEPALVQDIPVSAVRPPLPGETSAAPSTQPLAPQEPVAAPAQKPVAAAPERQAVPVTVPFVPADAASVSVTAPDALKIGPAAPAPTQEPSPLAETTPVSSAPVISAPTAPQGTAAVPMQEPAPVVAAPSVLSSPVAIEIAPVATTAKMSAEETIPASVAPSVLPSVEKPDAVGHIGDVRDTVTPERQAVPVAVPFVPTDAASVSVAAPDALKIGPVATAVPTQEPAPLMEETPVSSAPVASVPTAPVVAAPSVSSSPIAIENAPAATTARTSAEETVPVVPAPSVPSAPTVASEAMRVQDFPFPAARPPLSGETPVTPSVPSSPVAIEIVPAATTAGTSVEEPVPVVPAPSIPPVPAAASESAHVQDNPVPAARPPLPGETPVTPSAVPFVPQEPAGAVTAAQRPVPVSAAPSVPSAVEKPNADDQLGDDPVVVVPQLQAAPVTVPFAPVDSAPVAATAPVAIEIDPAAATARTHELVEAAVQVADTILVTPSLVHGEGEITIQLKPTVLDGSEIRLEAKGTSITVAITPATPSAAQTIAQAKVQFEQTLAERIPSFQIAVSVENLNLKTSRRKDTTV